MENRYCSTLSAEVASAGLMKPSWHRANTSILISTSPVGTAPGSDPYERNRGNKKTRRRRRTHGTKRFGKNGKGQGRLGRTAISKNNFFCKQGCSYELGPRRVQKLLLFRVPYSSTLMTSYEAPYVVGLLIARFRSYFGKERGSGKESEQDAAKGRFFLHFECFLVSPTLPRYLFPRENLTQKCYQEVSSKKDCRCLR